MRLLTKKAQFAAEFLDLPKAAQIDGAKWEPFQLRFLNNETRFGHDTKSRQVAWSFTAALDAVIDGILNPGTPHIFVSINLDEAKEKVLYAKNILKALDEPVRPKLARPGSQTELEFKNGSRLISHPCKPVRGKARARIYLDEMAHYPEGMDRSIYMAALPATTKGDGYIRIGSSPLGAKGLFWEIGTQAMKTWPGFYRQYIPWWHSYMLCNDIEKAKMEAPAMLTKERLDLFAKITLREIFENMFLEDFQQEYECSYIDESTAWITWEVIKRNQQKDLRWWHATNPAEAINMAFGVLNAVRSDEIEKAFVGGIDIGRKQNLTEFMIVGKAEDKSMPLRFSISLDRVEFDEQEKCFEKIIEILPFTKVLIDQNGLGMQLAENLTKSTGIAEGVDFTNSTKELWAVEARIQAERAKTILPLNREIAYQIHSIKKKITAAKNNVFDTERNAKHHADKFWAWALAITAAGNAHFNISEFEGLGQIKRSDSPWR